MNDKKLLSVMVMNLLFNKEYCRKSSNFWECVTAINEECGSGRKYDSIENGLHGDKFIRLSKSCQDVNSKLILMEYGNLFLKGV